MTDRVKEAMAELTKTIREIRESNCPVVIRREEGDFFTFTTPGTSSPTRTKAAQAAESESHR
jgi:hypothetical protein